MAYPFTLPLSTFQAHPSTPGVLDPNFDPRPRCLPSLLSAHNGPARPPALLWCPILKDRAEDEFLLCPGSQRGRKPHWPGSLGWRLKRVHLEITAMI